ncbi:MAG: DUF1552 domain-containing protein, partial [Bradymonadaceae bacterium]
MSSGYFNRRGFMKLVGATAASAAVPALPSLAHGAEGDGPPTRLIVFFTPNGTIRSRWRPDGSGTNFSIPEDGILTPLQAIKDKILIVDGLDMRSTQAGPGDGHQKGMGHMLTGKELLSGDAFSGGGGGTVGWARGPSVDQYIAEQTHDGERFKSINFAVQPAGPTVWSRMSYKGDANPVEPSQDPFNSFDRLFAPVLENQKKMKRIRTRRQSVLDFLKKDLDKVRREASAKDRKRLKQHLSSVRQTERRLMAGNDRGIACQPPDEGSRFDPQANDNFPQTGQLMMDMIAASLSCRLTRVATLQWNRSVGPLEPTWLGIEKRHYKMSHSDDKYEEQLVRLNRWYAKQYAYLVRKLDAIDEPSGEGTLLDHSIVLWCNELGDGSRHDRSDMPFVLAGGA